MKKHLFLIIAVAVYLGAMSQNTKAQCGPEGLTPCCGNPARACRVGEGALSLVAQAEVTKRSEVVRQVRQRLEKQRILRRKTALKTAAAPIPKKIGKTATVNLAKKTLPLFPVSGFRPGIKQQRLFSLVLDNECGELDFESIQPDGMQCYLRDGIHFYFDQDGVSDHLFVSRFRKDGMPAEWRALDFAWDLSYNQWMKLFEKYGYRVDQTKIPGPKSLGGGVRYFEGELTTEVLTNYGEMEVVLDFSNTIGTSKPTDRATLFSITVERLQ